MLFARTHLNQCEIRCATSHIANEDLLSRPQLRRRKMALAIDPGVKGGLRLFQQDNSPQSSASSCLDSQFPRDLVRRTRTADDHVLLFERNLRPATVPAATNTAH